MNTVMSEAEKQGRVNRLEISGWLTKDMAEQVTRTGKRPIKGKLAAYRSGSEFVMSLDLTIWPSGLSDEAKARYLSFKKGDRVVVTGAIEVNEWQGRVYVGVNVWSIEEA